MERISIAIVGGGIAGLSLGRALLKYDHIDLQIYEAVDKYKDYGSGLAMHHNAIQALELLDPALRQTYSKQASSAIDDENLEQATQVVIVAGQNKGTTVAQLGRAKNRKCIGRLQLLQGLQELLPWERVHYGKKLVRVDEHGGNGKIELYFGDGTMTKADCVIGADGVHSFVRGYLLGLDHPATYYKDHGLAMYGNLFSTDEVRDHIDPEKLLQPHIVCGPGVNGVFMPMDRGTSLSTWFTQEVQYGKRGEQTFDKFAYADCDKDTRFMAELVAKNPARSWYQQDHDPAPYYNRRRVVMIGDAAHATLPSNGQGAAQSLEDALVIATLLAKVTKLSQVSHAFQAFDEVRRPRSQKIAQLSRDFGEIYRMRYEPVGEDPALMKSYMGQGGMYANGVDLKAQNDAAISAFEALAGNTSHGEKNGV